jgi:hypothetical protein
MAIYSAIQMASTDNIPAPDPLPPESGRRPSVARKFLFGGVCFVLFIAVADMMIRMAGCGPQAYRAPRYSPAVPFTQLPKGPLVYQPGKSFSSIYDPAGDRRGYFGTEGILTYQINSLGARGPECVQQKGAGTLRIVCLGDSFTFGEGVKEADSYPSVLQSILAKKQPGTVEVINAGVQGYDTKDEAALFLMRYAAFKPDVVILGFVLNDASDSAETIRENQAMRSDLPLSALGHTWKIAEIIERRRAARRLQEEFFDTTRRSFDSPKWTMCKEILSGMTGVARDDHFRFIVVIFPIFWQLDANYPFAAIHKQIVDACKSAGCECIDLLDIYRGHKAESLWVHPTDQHPNEIAHRMAAERIASYLVEPRH